MDKRYLLVKRFVLFISSLVVLMAALYYITDNGADFKAKLAYGEHSFMEKVLIEQKKEGVLKWRLTADRAVHLSDEKIRLEDVTILLHEKDFSLTAKEAFYSMSNKNFEIPGEIKAYTKGYEIEGENLRWDAVSSSLKAEGSIRIKGKGFLLEGDDLMASHDKAQFNKNVKAVFYAK